ncbi:MAG: S1 RNA-binding domain-containing protein [Myxococcales bacterium]|nr:S1 RNA-binding domain-containing protein [Myxococcales bacterium]
MQPKNHHPEDPAGADDERPAAADRRLRRRLAALARAGLDVSLEGHVYRVRLAGDPHAPPAEVLLPEGFPVEGKALRQLAELAAARHPAGGHACRACASPDFHPGDAGVAIGSVVECEGMVIPAAVGSDINCGMRLHVVDLDVDRLLARRDPLVEALRGDFFFGTRDLPMDASAMRALFREGAIGWLDAVRRRPLGMMARVDLAAIEIAAASGAPIEGTFTKAVKGGLEVEIGGIRGFCPASQVDVTYVKDLEALVDQRVSFKVVEIRDGGRSVIVSRKAVLADERAERARALRDHLQIGAELDGTVTAVQPYGAFVDLGGMEGLVHISELGSGRVDKVEDVVRVGETVKVRIVSIEPRGGNPDDLKISLSMRLQDAAAASAGGGEVSGGGGEAISADEVLDGTVAHVASYGVFVDTPKGRGLVPLRELGLAPGADPKRSFPAGKEVKVVLLSRDEANNRLRFSISGVARAEERSNYRDFAKGSSGGKSGKPSGSSSGLGSLGDLLRDKIPEIPAGGGKGARKRR